MASTTQARVGTRRALGALREWRSRAGWRSPGGALGQLGGLAIATLAVGLVLGVELGSGPTFGQPPYLLLGLAVLLCACAAGAEAGVPAVALSAGALAYSFLPPPGLAIQRPADVWSVVLFAGAGLVVTGLCEKLREQRARIEGEAAAAHLEATGRRERAHAAARVESGLAALGRLGTAVTGELEPAEMATVAVEVAASIGGASVAMVCFQREGEPRALQEAAGAADQSRRLGSEWAVLAEASSGPALRRLDDVRDEDALARLGTGQDALRSLLLVRLDARSGRGLLVLGHPLPGAFDALHERLVQVLATQLVAALDAAHDRAQARQALADAQGAARTRDEFLATLSHELRTPLNVILSWAHLLQSRQLGPDDTRRAVETIARNASLQEGMIGELLEMSSLLNGRLRLDPAPLDLRRTVEEAVATARAYARAKSVELQLSTPLEAVPVTGDAGRLQQVLWSLLSNAVKFTPAGGRIRVRVAKAAGQAEVTVSDTGAGMDQEVLSRLFGRSSPADASSTRRVRGLGLGLAVARGIVELHDGQISAESAGSGLGSRFTVRLPLSPRPHGETLPAPERHPHGASPSTGREAAREGAA
jgi:signal transduction histidine kinase